MLRRERKNGERDGLKLRKVASQTSPCKVKEKEWPLTTSPLVFRKITLSSFLFPVVRLAASPNTCKYCMFWHILKSCISTFSFSKGWEQISFGSWQQGAGRRNGRQTGGWGHGSGLVASRTNAPAVNNPFFFFLPPIYPTDVSLSLSCPQAIPVNDLRVATESPVWQSNLFTAQNCWCVHRGGPCGWTVHWQELGEAGVGHPRKRMQKRKQEPERVVKCQGYLVLRGQLKRRTHECLPLFGLLTLSGWSSPLLLC